MPAKTVPLASLPDGVPFVFRADRQPIPTVYESRGGGWYQVFGQSENGGPWCCDGSTLVDVEADIPHPSQQPSCFV